MFDEIGNFLSGNSSWLKPVLSLGSNLYKKSESSSNMDDYIKLLRSQEDKNFADNQAYNSAAQAYNEQAQAAANANAAASAAASAANQRNAQAAQNKAAKQMDRTYGENMDIFRPYKETADKLLPQMTAAYESGLGGLNMLNAYLNSPEQLAKMNQSKPQWATGAPVPKWAK